MSNRDFAVTALGRLLAVERYRESCQPSSIDHPARSRPDRDLVAVNRSTDAFPASRHAPRRLDLRS